MHYVHMHVPYFIWKLIDSQIVKLLGSSQLAKLAEPAHSFFGNDFYSFNKHLSKKGTFKQLELKN